MLQYTFRVYNISHINHSNNIKFTEKKVGKKPMNLNSIVNQFAIDELSVSSNGPTETPENKPGSQGHINDDLFLGRLLLIPNGNQVAPTHPPDPPGNVEEEQSGGDKLTPVPLVTAHNQVGQPVRPA
uniref:Uncharacterized protein n=1 Tax=Opuntia streptacantha TaxID=393608 RepID=A0A7C8ZJ22_OPUST